MGFGLACFFLDMIQLVVPPSLPKGAAWPASVARDACVQEISHQIRYRYASGAPLRASGVRTYSHLGFLGGFPEAS